MRIDKYLKVSRVIKRRSVANTACSGGRVKINGKTVKPSAEVKEGDVVEVAFGSGITKFVILSVKESVRKEEAALMFKMLKDNPENTSDENS